MWRLVESDFLLLLFFHSHFAVAVLWYQKQTRCFMFHWLSKRVRKKNYIDFYYKPFFFLELKINCNCSWCFSMNDHSNMNSCGQSTLVPLASNKTIIYLKYRSEGKKKGKNKQTISFFSSIESRIRWIEVKGAPNINSITLKSYTHPTWIGWEIEEKKNVKRKIPIEECIQEI